MRRGGCVLLRAGWCLTGGESESQGGSPGTMFDFAPPPPPRSTTPRRRSSFKGAGDWEARRSWGHTRLLTV